MERTELRANQRRHQTPSIFQISPVRVTTYAVFPMNSSEVGRSRPSVMTVKVPSPLTLTSAPVFGTAYSVGTRVDRAVREGVETAAAKFHVKEERGAGGYLRGGGRSRPERHNLAGLGQVGVGAGLGHVHRIASHLQPGRDDVVERRSTR